MNVTEFINLCAPSIISAAQNKSISLTINEAPSPKFIINNKELVCKKQQAALILMEDYKDTDVYHVIANGIYELAIQLNKEKVDVYILDIGVVTLYQPIESNDLNLHYEIMSPTASIAFDY